MTITVTITDIEDNDEAHDALLGAVAPANTAIAAENVRRAALPTPLEPLPDKTTESYCEDCLTHVVNSYKQQAYDRAVASIGTAAKALPYENRKALIASLNTQLGA